MKQSEAVYKATMSVLSDNSIHFEDGGKIEDVMTKELRANVHAIVCESFKSGSVEFKDTASNREKLSNDSKLSQYVSGLISNWYRKDERFNGGVKYQPKNPGSRAGQGDPTLKALRQVLRQFEGVDEEKTARIQEEIDTRLAVLRTERAKKVTIDITQLPTHLIAELGLDEDAA